MITISILLIIVCHLFKIIIKWLLCTTKYFAQSAESKIRSSKVSRHREHLQTRVHAQMESFPDANQEKLEENRGKDVESQQITEFAEAHIIHNAPAIDEDYWLNNTMPPVDLDKFLLRPIFLGTQTWSSTDALGTLLGTWVFPDVYQNNVTIQSKLEKIAFWKPTFEISIRMNGTPMHYGKLIFAWVPQASSLNPAYYSTYFQGFSNNWIQVSASANQTTTITIPFTHYKDFISVGALNPDLFTLHCWVSAPLNSVNGAPPGVNFTTYARVIKSNIMGYNYGTNWVAQMETTIKPNSRRVRSLKTEAEEKTDSGKVLSTTLSNVGDFVSKFSIIPGIGSLATTISTGANIAAGIAKFFGFNIPVNLATTLPMQIRQPRYLQIEDNITSLTLGTAPSLSVSKDYAFVNDTIDSASILKFIQRPACHYVGRITAANTAGTVLYQNRVTPNDYACWDYTSAFDPALFSCTPINWFSNMFGYWRGGMRIHLSFICSHFHSFRVRIWYVPYASGIATAGDTGLNETLSQDVVNVVLDVTKETDFSFTIPYCQQTDWLRSNPLKLGPASMSKFIFYNGYWGITLINPLTSGASTVSPVYYQVFVSAASDFQFAVPNSAQLMSSGVYAPQSEYLDSHFLPQSEFELTECEISSNSMKCLMEKDYPPLGGVAVGRTTTGVYMGNEITSIKQLTNMLSSHVSWNPSTTGEVPIWGIGGYGDYTNLTPALFNYRKIMQSVFRYQRGGVRVVMRTVDENATCQVIVSDLSYISNETLTEVVLNTPTGDINLATVTPGVIPYGFLAEAQFSNLSMNPADMIIPWFSQYRCFPNTSSGTNGINNDNLPGFIVRFNCISPGSDQWLMSSAGADDYILGFQLPIPLHKYPLS